MKNDVILTQNKYLYQFNILSFFYWFLKSIKANFWNAVVNLVGNSILYPWPIRGSIHYIYSSEHPGGAHLVLGSQRKKECYFQKEKVLFKRGTH